MVMMFQTIKRDSLFQRLDFRVKLFIAVVVTILAFIWESPIAGAALVLSLIIWALAVGVQWSYIRTICSVMLVFGIFLIITHGFFNTSQVETLTGGPLTPIFTIDNVPILGSLSLSVQGILYGLNALFKTLSMVLIIPITIFTTDVNHMVVSMVKMGIPYKITFVFSSTLRFFPMLFEEIHSIIEAQRLRGLPVEKMGPLKKVSVYAKVAIPLMLSALTKAQMTEVVLQSKAFDGSKNRTYLHETVFTKADYAMLFIFFFLFVGLLAMYFIFGVGQFKWLLY